MTCLKELSSREKPREKLIQHGARLLTDPELLAILLRTGTRGCSVLDMARNLLASLPGGNLGCLGEITLSELCRIRGIGPDKAVTLCAAVELGRRIVRCRVRRDNPDFSSPQVIAEYVMEDMRFLPQERFAAVYLSTKNQLLRVQTLTVGTINASLAKARDVFRYALQCNAAAVVLLHNHPSGNVKPSKEDMIVTRKLQKCGQLLGIELLDHIIVGGTNGKMLSFREEKMLNVTGRMDWER